MGITDRSAAGNLSGIINQRLLRRLCSNCKRETEVIDADVERFSSAGLPTPTKLFARVGCEVCRGTGFRGRIGVFEVALMSDDVSMAIADGKSEHAIGKLLRSLGVKSLTVDALKKAADGTTSVAEAMSVRWLA
jgi:type II secretory ATPase GspE/PulE/Tfp pilus assembly ATPase PilB-like protein